jgi:hypothetical protein
MMEKKHLQVAMWVICGLFGMLMSLLIYIWEDYKSQQIKHNQNLERIYDRLESSMTRTVSEVAEIKKYLLIKDGFDVDERTKQSEWERLIKEHQEKGSGRRGSTIQQQFDFDAIEQSSHYAVGL